MSMPSSRLLVATTAGSRPDLRSSSMSARCSLLTEPWCARREHRRARRRWRRPGAIACAAGARRSSSALAGGALDPDLVEPRGEPLGEPARVGEHDRGAVRGDEVDHALLDVRPDRRAPVVAGGRAARPRRSEAPSAAMSSTGHDDLEVDGLGARRLHDGDRAASRRGTPRPRRPGARWPTGRSAARAARAARRAARARSRGARRAWCRRRACTSSTITVLDAAQRLARLRGEQQEQRLGRGDEDVRRARAEAAPLVGRGVAGAHADRDVGLGQAEAAGTRGGCR